MAGARKSKVAAAEAVGRPSANARRIEIAHGRSKYNDKQNNNKIVKFKLPQAMDKQQTQQKQKQKIEMSQETTQQQQDKEMSPQHQNQITKEHEPELTRLDTLSEQHMREREEWLNQHQKLLEQQEKLLQELRAQQLQQLQQQQHPSHNNSGTSSEPKMTSALGVPSEIVGPEQITILQEQVHHLAQLSDKDFERDFRKWITEEGVGRNLHVHLRAELIKTFNRTPLGQQLFAMSTPRAHVLCPLSLSLHTLVAEFLHQQSCQYTLSVYCAEIPYQRALPDFEKQPTFRFNDGEVLNIIAAVLSMETETEALKPLHERVLEHYHDKQSLLFALFKVLLEGQRRSQELNCTHADTMAKAVAPARTNCRSKRTQTQPTACLASTLNVNYSQLLEVDCSNNDVLASQDGQSVFVGPRICQALRHVERQLSLLVRQTQKFAKSCAPPVEVISGPSFEQLMQLELRERQRLKRNGEQLSPNQLALPTLVPAPQLAPVVQQPSIVETPLGAITMPVLGHNLPQKPALHPEQLGSLAMVRQVLEQLQLRLQQPQGKVHSSLERVELLMGEICLCLQALRNMLNLAMEQEHSVGCHKGFKQGYKEGFSHGHYVGVQEGEQVAKRRSGELSTEVGTQTLAEGRPSSQRHVETNTASELLGQMPCRDATTNTRQSLPPTQCHSATNTEQNTMCNAHIQTQQEEPVEKPYEQWIYEMLNSQSGQVFLERVELSLNKALVMQKERLDDLYEIKMRHQTELLRINQKKCSWRALCRRVERDSSEEASELVHKIFRLLENYERNNQALINKIHQTEQAAELIARVMPKWNDTVLSSVLPTATSCSSSTTAMPEDALDLQRREQRKVRLKQQLKEQQQQQQQASRQLKPQAELMDLLSQQLQPQPPLPPAVLMPNQQYQPESLASQQYHPPPPVVPMPNQQYHRMPIVSQQYQMPPTVAPMPNQQYQPPAALCINSSQLIQPNQLFQPPAAAAPFTPFYQPLPAVAAQVEQPAAKPTMSTVATNTVCHAATSPIVPVAPPVLPVAQQAPRTAASLPPEQVFNDALLSAKIRMAKLEEESELLERSFRSYFERSKLQKSVNENVARKMRERCARECQQINDKLDSCRKFQQCYGNDDIANDSADLLEHNRLTSTQLEDECRELLNSYEPSSDQDSFEFTNAIAVARSKLLGELQLKTAAVSTSSPAKQTKHSFEDMLKSDRVQQWVGAAQQQVSMPSASLNETAQLLDEVSATMTRAVATARPHKRSDVSASEHDKKNWIHRAKWAMEQPLSNQPDWQHVGGGDSTASSVLSTSTAAAERQPVTGAGDGSASSLEDEEALSPATRKLQRSMARMQQLFALAATPSREACARPMSAPLSHNVLDMLPAQPKRPHTAPSYSSFLQSSSPSPMLTPAQSLQHYIDDMPASDSYSHSSHKSTLEELQTPRGAYTPLVSPVTRVVHDSDCYSSEQCDSQQFWKRLNL